MTKTQQQQQLSNNRYICAQSREVTRTKTQLSSLNQIIEGGEERVKTEEVDLNYVGGKEVKRDLCRKP